MFRSLIHVCCLVVLGAHLGLATRFHNGTHHLSKRQANVANVCNSNACRFGACEILTTSTYQCHCVAVLIEFFHFKSLDLSYLFNWFFNQGSDWKKLWHSSGCRKSVFVKPVLQWGHLHQCGNHRIQLPVPGRSRRSSMQRHHKQLFVCQWGHLSAIIL